MVTIQQLTELCKEVQKDIEPEFRADWEDTEPSILLTIGTDENGDMGGFQTGDNSFMGAAYSSPIWGVTAIYEDSDCEQLAAQLLEDIEHQVAETQYILEGRSYHGF